MDHASTFAPTLVYISTLSAAGLMGNSVVFFIYLRRFKPSTTRTYILALCVCDLLVNAVSLPMDFVFRILKDVHIYGICRVNGAVKALLVIYSGFILVAVARDRYNKVCQPTRSRDTPRATRKVLAVCGAMAAGSAVPTAIITGRQTFHSSVSNQTGSTCFVDDAFVESQFLLAYIVMNFVLFFVCVAIMVLSYGLIARRLVQHKMSRKAQRASFRKTGTPDGILTVGGGSVCSILPHTHDLENSQTRFDLDSRAGTKLNSSTQPNVDSSSSPLSTLTPAVKVDSEELVPDLSDKKRMETEGQSKTGSVARRCQPKGDKYAPWRVKKIPRRTTLMMFVLTVVFVINFLPYLAAIAVFRGKEDIGASFWGLNLYQVAVRSYFMNSAINPLVYGFCSASFRHHCLRLCLCKFRDKLTVTSRFG